MTNPSEVLALASVIISVALALNIFFVKRLVSKIEGIPVMGEKLDHLEREVRELNRKFMDVIHIRERVAILEFSMGLKKGKEE